MAKYSKNDIKVVDFKDHLIRNEQMYFGTRGANPQFIVTHIAEGAFVLGSGKVTIENVDGWWIVASDRDWLNAPNSINTTEKNVFESLRAFPESGQNNYRGEFMAMIYSSALVIITNSTSTLMKGLDTDLKAFERICGALECNVNVLGFKFAKEI